MDNLSTAAPDKAICKVCGHERKDHELDDSCWREVEVKGRTILCTSAGFQAVEAAKPEPANLQWFEVYREAVLERDSDQLVAKILNAEAVVRQRMSDVKPSDGREWQKLRDALATLKAYKKAFQYMTSPIAQGSR